jgi:16S rRNA (guanine(966)-N(2))-methyltransferase RsmD
MRIIGGTYKGRMFHPGKKFKARPTTDIAKEGLFNILENRYEFSTKSILDLFSGTGSISYEFLSRGVEKATMIEKDFMHYRFIQSVINELKITNATIFRADVFKYIEKTGEKFNIIFADPPFDLPNINEIADAVFNADILADEGLLIVEHPKNVSFSTHEHFKEIRNYGKVNFSFFE